jgi:hypothetical protein
MKHLIAKVQERARICDQRMGRALPGSVSSGKSRDTPAKAAGLVTTSSYDGDTTVSPSAARRAGAASSFAHEGGQFARANTRWTYSQHPRIVSSCA